MSDLDISAGQRWQDEIGTKLQESDAGIVIVTRQNFERPWLNFEAGAISKSLRRGRPMPLLFDVKSTEISGPLVQFQAKEADRDGVFTVLSSLNEILATALKPAVLQRTFDKFWPELETKFQAIRDSEPETTPRQERTTDEMLKEILTIVRGIDARPSVLQGGVSFLTGAADDLRPIRGVPLSGSILGHSMVGPSGSDDEK